MRVDGITKSDYSKALGVYKSKLGKVSYQDIKDEEYSKMRGIKPIPSMDYRSILSPVAQVVNTKGSLDTNSLSSNEIVLGGVAKEEALDILLNAIIGSSSMDEALGSYFDSEDPIDDEVDEDEFIEEEFATDDEEELVIEEEDEFIEEDEFVEDEDEFVEDEDESIEEDDEFIDEDELSDEIEIEDYDYQEDSQSEIEEVEWDADGEGDEVEWESDDSDDNETEWEQNDEDLEDEDPVEDSDSVTELDDKSEYIDSDTSIDLDGVENTLSSDQGVLPIESSISPNRVRANTRTGLQDISSEPISFDSLDKDGEDTNLDYINSILASEKTEETTDEVNSSEDIPEVEEEIKKDLPSSPIEYLRQNPRSKEQDVKDYYSAKEVDKYISRGLIQRSRGRLFI